MEAGALIEAYGYWALAVGCFLEGETVLVLAGFAAHRGHLDMAWVITIATVAASAGDQCFFLLGRRHGKALLARFPSLARETARIRHLALRYDAWLIVIVRFTYGLRMAGPVLIGTTTISAPRFMLFNVLGAVLWAILVSGLGWLFGKAFESALENLQHLEVPVLVGFVAATVLAWWLRRRHRRRQGR